MSAELQPTGPGAPRAPETERKETAGTPLPERPSVSFRLAAGVLVAALLGVGLMHWLLVRRFASQTESRIERAAMISGLAAADVAEAHGGEGEGLRVAVAEWQKAHPNVRAVRVVDIDNRTLEASSFPEDLQSGALPRRLQRPEKALFDLGQELRGNVEANVQEQSKREEEVSVVRQPDGSIVVTAPFEREGSVAGFAQVRGTPEIVAVAAPNGWFAVAFAVAPFVVILALTLAGGASSRRRRLLLTLAGAVLMLVALFAYRQWAMSTLETGARTAEQRFAERVQREATVVARVAPAAAAKASTWDADVHRQPLHIDPAKAVEGEKSAMANASYGIAALSLAVFLFIGLGMARRTAAALRRNRQAYFYVAPAMVGMLLLVFFPFIYGVSLSFTSQTIYTVNKPLTEIWIGVQNYVDILGDFGVVRHTPTGRVANFENFYWTLFFTVAWTVVNVTIGVTVGLLLALILNTKGLRAKGAYRVLLILPWAVPNYITALIWRGMFHRQFGVMNQLLAMFGGSQVSWFEHPSTAFIAVVATNGWLSFPFMMVVSLGALQSISGDLYEAARVDGASRWQQFASITLPSLKPALIPAIILSVVWTFNMFNIIYLVSAGEPAHSTEILITQAYKLAFEQYRYGYAAAYSTIIFAILLIYGVFQNRITRATEAISS